MMIENWLLKFKGDNKFLTFFFFAYVHTKHNVEFLIENNQHIHPSFEPCEFGFRFVTHFIQHFERKGVGITCKNLNKKKKKN